MKNFMKRSFALLLTLVMLLSMAACGAEESAPAATNAPAADAPAGEAAPAVDPLAITPYSDGPRPIEEIVAEMLSEYDLPEVSE